MKLLLKSADGESVSVSILKSDTFSDLKTRLSEEYNIDIDLQDLSIEGKPIQNNLNVIRYLNSNINKGKNESTESWSPNIYRYSTSSQNLPNKQLCQLQKNDDRCSQWLESINQELPDPEELSDTDGLENNYICRLCAGTYSTNVLIDVFEVADKIKSYLQLKIEPDDNLSKLICLCCLKKLEKVKEFIDSCLNAEKRQLELIEKKKEKNIPHCDLNDLVKHFKKFNEKIKILSRSSKNEDEIHCSICKKNTLLTSYLQGDCHSGNIFSCFTCDFTSDTQKIFLDHLKTHFKQKKSQNFKCDKCSKSFRCKNRLEFHIQFHLKGSKAGQCLECNKEFPSELCLYKHMLYNHLNPKIFTCEHCGKNFRNKSSLTYHLRSHKSFEAMRPFKCELCDRRFARKNILRDHMTNRHGENNSKTCFQCRECKEVFPNTASGISHMQIHHPDFFDEKNGYTFDMLTLNKLFACEFCDKCFSSASFLTEHRLLHSSPMKFQCKMCNEEFLSNIDLKTHQDGHSSDGILDYKTDFQISILYICEFCEKCLKNYQSYSSHIVTHKSKENPYECKFCPENFVSYDLALSHRKTHSFEAPSNDLIKPFDCQYCDKGFTSGSALVKHVRIHTGEKPFLCRICNKSFRQSSGLYTHLKVHSNDRPYQCDLCDRSFKIVGDYKQHVRRHSGVRPFSCEICLKTFMTQRSFTQHKKVHGDEKRFVCDVCNEVFRKFNNFKTHKLKHKKNDKML